MAHNPASFQPPLNKDSTQAIQVNRLTVSIGLGNVFYNVLPTADVEEKVKDIDKMQYLNGALAGMVLTRQYL